MISTFLSSRKPAGHLLKEESKSKRAVMENQAAKILERSQAAVQGAFQGQ